MSTDNLAVSIGAGRPVPQGILLSIHNAKGEIGVIFQLMSQGERTHE